jgi:acid phosphatase
MDHVVVVVMENKGFSDIIGRPDEAPYLNDLASQGAVFTNSKGITHPSQPNYIGLFSGSTQGVTNDDCPKNFSNVPNLGADLIQSGFTFAGYSESLPGDGSTTCGSGDYARKHNPWVDFNNVPASSNKTFAEFPKDYSQLPSVSFVTPNLCSDMHDCSRDTGDAWLHANIDPYAQWAKSHNSMLIVTWDEDAGSDSANRIPTIFYGAHITPGNYDQQIDHYSILRTLEDMYHLEALGSAQDRTPITAPFDCCSAPPVAMSFAANTRILWTVDRDGVGHNLNLGMAAGTSPSIVALPSGGTEIAFQADTGALWTVDSSGVGHPTGLTMAPKTSPSMVALPSGGTEIAFQANTGSLWRVDSNGVGHNIDLSMAAGTSPSISASGDIAFQANTGILWRVDGNDVGHNIDLGMAAGTSPSISASGDIAFQANTGILWTVDRDGVGHNLNLGMAAGTSPELAVLPSGSTEIAFQANTGALWTVDAYGVGHSTTLTMAPGAGPSIAAF